MKIAVGQSKGGVGKTTTAVNLAAGLAIAKYRVLLVDLDTQSSAAAALGIEPESGLAEVILDKVPIEQVLVEARPNLDYLGGGRRLAALKSDIGRRNMAPEQVLTRVIASIEKHYRFVILDMAPSWDVLSVNALFAADKVLMPVSMEMLTLRGVREFVYHVQEVAEYRPLEIQWVVPTFVDGRVKKSSEILDQVIAVYGNRVTAPIRYNVRLSEAPGWGKTIYEYDPASAGATDYAQLVIRVAADGYATANT